MTALTQILEQDEHDMNDIHISFLEELLMDLKKKLPHVDDLRIQNECKLRIDELQNLISYMMAMKRQQDLMRLVDHFLDITLRHESERDMRVWWITDRKWRHVLVLQFNFNVLMHFFRVCYSSLNPENKWHQMFNERDFEKFSDIKTLFEAYISDIEQREDY